MQMDHYTISFTILIFLKINLSGSEYQDLDKSNLGRLPSFGQFTSFRNFISDVVKFILTPCWIKSYLPQAAFDADIDESCFERFWLRLNTIKSRTPCAKIFDDECLIVRYLFGQYTFIMLYLNMWLHWIGLFLRNTNYSIIGASQKQAHDLYRFSHTVWVIQYDVYSMTFTISTVRSIMKTL